MKYALLLVVALAACTPYTPVHETRPTEKKLSDYMIETVEALWGNTGGERR